VKKKVSFKSSSTHTAREVNKRSTDLASGIREGPIMVTYDIK
jgi:hypothetical protein